MTYKADSNQLGFLQILSTHATQNITYHCKKSVAYYDEEKKSHRRSLKLLAWNDAELTARGSQRLKYEALEDGCRVSFTNTTQFGNLVFNSFWFFAFHYFQTRSNSWAKTVIIYNTDKASRLPIIDVAIRDVGQTEQEFWIEIGSVCYQNQDQILQ